MRPEIEAINLEMRTVSLYFYSVKYSFCMLYLEHAICISNVVNHSTVWF